MGTTCFYPFNGNDRDIYNSGCTLEHNGGENAFKEGTYRGGAVRISGFELRADTDWSVECSVQFTGKDMASDWQTPLVLSASEVPDSSDGCDRGNAIVFYQGIASNSYNGQVGMANVSTDPEETKRHTYKIANNKGMVQQYIDGRSVFGYSISGVEVYKYLRIGRGGCLDDPEMRVQSIRITGITKGGTAPTKPQPSTSTSTRSWFPYSSNFNDVYNSGVTVKYDGARGITGGRYMGSGIHISGFELHGDQDFTIEFSFQYAQGMAGDWNCAFVLSESEVPDSHDYNYGRTISFGQTTGATGYSNGEGHVTYSSNPGDTQERSFKIVNRSKHVTMYVNGGVKLKFDLTGGENYKFMRFGHGGCMNNPTFKLRNFRVEGYYKKSAIPAPKPSNCNCNCSTHKNNGQIAKTTLSGIERNNQIRSNTYNTLAKALEDLNGYGRQVDNCGNCISQCKMTCQRCQKCQGCQR